MVDTHIRLVNTVLGLVVPILVTPLSCWQRTKMKTDLGLKATREVRVRISREHGNDPRQLVEYYMSFQNRFSDRLRWAPGSDHARLESAATGGTPA